MEGSDRRLYGSTGDADGAVGIIFRMNKDGSDFTTLYQAGTKFPLLEGSDGALYAVLAGEWDPDGFYIGHTISQLSKEGGANKPLASVACNGGLIEGTDHALYGVGPHTNGLGIVFKVGMDGSNFEVLHEFTGGAGGEEPQGRLLKSSDGALYGTTRRGGVENFGTVFKLNEDGSGFQVIYGEDKLFWPQGDLVEDDDGMLYGTASGGGGDGVGMIFQVQRDGSQFRMLWAFSHTVGDGRYPAPGLTVGPDRAVYGAATTGGGHESGMLFKFTLGIERFEVLHHFGGLFADGREPSGLPVLGRDGLLYGMTGRGGDQDLGTVYRASSELPQVRIQSLEFIASGARLRMSGGDAGATYRIEAALELSENWRTVGTSTAELDGAFEFLDRSSTLYPIRYYRIVAP
jgi:uncharacterized repeat protein (TIGR03803 family)